MRLTSDFFVSALMRRVFSTGGFAAVLRRGAAEAGSIFVLCRAPLGTVSLYGPAPQTSYDSARPDDRFFAALLDAASEEDVQKRLDREQRFDTDIWIVEIEPGSQPVNDLLLISPP
jgi:hypothetical protein